MATITSTLSKIGKDSNLAEILFYFCGGRSLRCRLKSGLYVNPQNWSEKTNAPKQIKLDKKHAELCKKYNELTSLLLEKFQTTDSELVSKELLENTIEKYHHPEKFEEKPNTLINIIALFVANLDTRQTMSGKNLTESTKWQYKASLKHITEFANSQKISDFELSEINTDFYKSYVTYLQKKGRTTNTIGKEIKVLKTIINSLDSEIRNQCDISKFHVTKEDVDSTYLNESELAQLKDCDLSKQPYLERVRDWFLLLAWTGSRFSDLEKITKADADNGFITFRQLLLRF